MIKDIPVIVSIKIVGVGRKGPFRVGKKGPFLDGKKGPYEGNPGLYMVV